MVFSCLRAKLKLEASVVKREDTRGKKRGGPATSVVAEARGCNIKAIWRQKEWGNEATLSDVQQIPSTVKNWQSDRLKKNLTEKHSKMTRNKLPNCKTTESVLFFFSPCWKPHIKRQRYLHTERTDTFLFYPAAIFDLNAALDSQRETGMRAEGEGAGVYFPCITFQGVIREGEVWISSKWGFVKG